MCTVSFYRDNSKVIITSNRDEHINRPSAISLKKHRTGQKQCIIQKTHKQVELGLL